MMNDELALLLQENASLRAKLKDNEVDNIVKIAMLSELLRYADNKLYILTHNRSRDNISPRLLTDADKAYKAVHDAVVAMTDNPNALLIQYRKALVDAAFCEGGDAQKAFWAGFESAHLSHSTNIREQWNKYKDTLAKKSVKN